MNIWMRCTIFLAGLMLAGSAAAVTLSTDGDGQVLIYPYYTVNAERNSTLALSNTTDQAKAVKLDFRSGADGSAAFVLNVYLGAYDTWTGTLFHWGDGANAGPAMVSNDSSCTVPSLHAANLPTLPDGRHYLRPNAGGQAAAPSGEGYVTAIEMGTLSGASAEALKFPYAPDQPPAPADCGKFIAAWQSGGDWQKDPSMDISAPSGGLSGTMTIIKVAQGTVFRVDATALKDFRVAAMHTAPEVTTPDLGDALSNAETGVATANIPIGNQVIQSDYPAERSIDAVSAVLMAQELKTHYDFRPTIGARTAFVLNMPTKRFYVTDKNNVIAPFGRDTFHLTSSAGTVCPIVNIVGANRHGVYGVLYGVGLKPSIDPEARFVPQPCYATSVLALDPKIRPRSVLDSELTSEHPLAAPGNRADAGPATLLMNFYIPQCYSDAQTCFYRDQDYTRAHINLMRPDLEGRQYFGLPAIGFAATDWINDRAAGPGVLANYSFVSSSKRVRVCLQDGTVGGCH